MNHDLPLLSHTDLGLADGDLHDLLVHVELRGALHARSLDLDGGGDTSDAQHDALDGVGGLHLSGEPLAGEDVRVERHLHVGELALLVAVAVALVVEDASGGLSPLVGDDAQREGVVLHLRRRAAQTRLQRHDGSGALQHGDEVQWRVERDGGAAGDDLLVVDAVPLSVREVDASWERRDSAT